jgi:hypothetical protein
MVEGLYYPQTRTVDVTLCATLVATHPTAARSSAAPGVSPVDTGPVAVIHAQVSAAVPVTPPGSSTASRGVCGRHEQCGGGERPPATHQCFGVSGNGGAALLR